MILEPRIENNEPDILQEVVENFQLDDLDFKVSAVAISLYKKANGRDRGRMPICLLVASKRSFGKPQHPNLV